MNLILQFWQFYFGKSFFWSSNFVRIWDSLSSGTCWDIRYKAYMTFCLPGWLDKKGKGAYVSLPVVLQLVFDPLLHNVNVAAKPQTVLLLSLYNSVITTYPRLHLISIHFRSNSFARQQCQMWKALKKYFHYNRKL